MTQTSEDLGIMGTVWYSKARLKHFGKILQLIELICFRKAFLYPLGAVSAMLSGMMFHAAPNIDHSQEFVRQDISAWLRWLRKIGFDGWRLDFVRGFEGKYIKEYMQASNPQFAVGEFWDSMDYEGDGTLSFNQDSHRQRICDWINATGDLSVS